MQQHILAKTGMKNSGFITQHAIVPKLAKGYSLLPEGWKNPDYYPQNVGFSAGAIYATAEDLFKWRNALNGGKIIGRKALEKMNTPNHPNRGAGYGIMVDNFMNKKVIEHQGAVFGLNMYIGEFPEEGVTIIVLCNRDTNLDFVPKGLSAIMLGKEVEPFYRKKPVTFSGKADKFAGEFTSPELPFPVKIISKDNKLYWQMWREVELKPESQTKFYIDEQDIDVQLEYKLDGSGNISNVYFISAGIRNELKKA